MLVRLQLLLAMLLVRSPFIVSCCERDGHRLQFNSWSSTPFEKCQHGTSVARWYIFKPKIPIWVNFGRSCNWRYWYFCDSFVHSNDIFYSHLLHFVAICYLLWSFGIVSPVLVCCTDKNLATLQHGTSAFVGLEKMLSSFFTSCRDVLSRWTYKLLPFFLQQSGCVNSLNNICGLNYDHKFRWFLQIFGETQMLRVILRDIWA
jgi:hypothetical protein